MNQIRKTANFKISVYCTLKPWCSGHLVLFNRLEKKYSSHLSHLWSSMYSVKKKNFQRGFIYFQYIKSYPKVRIRLLKIFSILSPLILLFFLRSYPIKAWRVNTWQAIVITLPYPGQKLIRLYWFTSSFLAEIA